MSAKVNLFREHLVMDDGEGVLGGRGRAEGSRDSSIAMGGVVRDRSTKGQHRHDNDNTDDDREDDEEDTVSNCWARLKRKSKLDMSDSDLSNYCNCIGFHFVNGIGGQAGAKCVVTGITLHGLSGVAGNIAFVLACREMVALK